MPQWSPDATKPAANIRVLLEESISSQSQICEWLLLSVSCCALNCYRRCLEGYAIIWKKNSQNWNICGLILRLSSFVHLKHPTMASAPISRIYAPSFSVQVCREGNEMQQEAYKKTFYWFKISHRYKAALGAQ